MAESGLLSLVYLLKTGSNKIKISNVLPRRIKQTTPGRFMDYIKKSICVVVRSGLHYELIRQIFKNNFRGILAYRMPTKYAKRFLRCVVKSRMVLRKHRFIIH
jgi:hypothetical protein